MLRNIFPTGARIPDLRALKDLIDTFCDSCEKEVTALALDVLGVPEPSAGDVLTRWEDAGRPAFGAFAPYTAHVFKVELLYYLGIDRGFISGDRASNKADMAYLYYLPFSMVFTSGDNLHRRTAPLFLRQDQSFVEASAFKAALRELDEYYDQFPEEVKALGVMVFAHYPPPNLNNLVVELWDKHMRPDWRDGAETSDEVRARWQRTQEQEASTDFRARIDSAQPVADTESQLEDEPDYIVIGHQVPVRKGKWRLLPEEVENAEEEDGSR